jgi:hypothetical protein
MPRHSWQCVPPGTGKAHPLGRLAEDCCGALHDKGDITIDRALDLELTVSVGPTRRTLGSLTGLPGGDGCTTQTTHEELAPRLAQRP